jgi:N-acetyl-anhydromuramyl-L-alanine amidase AmpD
MKFYFVSILSLLILIFSFKSDAQDTLKIVDKPIIFDSLRTKLSLSYLRERHDIDKTIPSIDPKMIVLHWTGSTSVKSTFEAFNKPELSTDRKYIAKSGNLNVSSHFLVDRDGTIYRLLPDTVFARHVIGLNYCAIGIENVGSGRHPLTQEQLIANERLVRHLKEKYQIEYLIGHSEYTLFKNSSLWKEKDANYQTGKADPGADFMQKIRDNLKDLNLKPVPDKLLSSI